MSQPTSTSSLAKTELNSDEWPLWLRYAIGGYFWATGLLTTILLFLLCMVGRALTKVGLVADDGRFIHRIATMWGRSMIYITPGWRVTIEGQEHLPRDGQAAVMVSNHESMCDIFALYFLGIQFRWLSKQEVFRIPIIGHAMRWAQYVPVLRGDTQSQKIAMDLSRRRLDLGVTMVFFPEGTRSIDGRIKEFKSGAFRLARDAKVPIVPVAMLGSSRMLKKGTGLPGKSWIKIRILPQVPAPSEGTNLAVYSEQVRSSIISAHEQLKRGT